MKIRNPKSEIRNPKPAGSVGCCGWRMSSEFGLRHSFGFRISDFGFQRGSTFIIVLWIAFGLVSVALYFGQAMSFELRASDNRVSGLAAEQAIEGAARYVSYVLANQLTNGVLPDPGSYVNEAGAIGDAHFWLIGRDTNSVVGAGQLAFGLVDEASKINLNSASSNILAGLLEALPRANPDLVPAILDWRDTNSPGTYQTYYATRPQAYRVKSAPFETVDELRLLYGGDMETLAVEDLNRNGVLDANETDEDQNGQVQPGVLEYVTVYSREPNTRADGSARVNIRVVNGTSGPLPSLLRTNFGSTRADQILSNLGLLRIGPVGPGRPSGAVAVTLLFTSPLQFYRASRMTADEFARIANDITVVSTPYIQGRINVNTASATVLSALPGLSADPDLAQTLVSYRQSNPDKLGSIAWVVEALGQGNNSTVQALQGVDCLTTQSYQFSADIAAVGPHGRGYRRARFVFDTSEGAPKIIYRQDLTHLGWALGREIRQSSQQGKAGG